MGRVDGTICPRQWRGGRGEQDTWRSTLKSGGLAMVFASVWLSENIVWLSYPDWKDCLAIIWRYMEITCCLAILWYFKKPKVSPAMAQNCEAALSPTEAGADEYSPISRASGVYIYIYVYMYIDVYIYIDAHKWIWINKSMILKTCMD